MVVMGSALVLGIAYRFMGRRLARLVRLDDTRETPAVVLRDDLDYEPIEPRFLLGQHFSAIAAAGPVVGPILAGVMFGWAPALAWILIGAIFVGGVHDFMALVASVRHRARSIAEVVREHMTKRSYLLFLGFVWIALVYIIVAFTDIVAASFVGALTLDDGATVSGGGVATTSLLYLALPLLMGLALRFTRLPLWLATLVFLPLVGAAVWAGQQAPLDLTSLFGIADVEAARWWALALLGYCFVASLAPLWLLLQPRGHLGGFLLYATLAAGVIGIVLGNPSIANERVFNWSFTAPDGSTSPLFPLLFITIACGACSGFHCLIASGTTSKQLRRETDAKVIGYGAMLLEAMVAVISLACVMVLTTPQAEALLHKPSLIYAQGLARFLDVIGIPAAAAVGFGLLAFTTFVYDTLDVCTRLGRFILQELFNLHGAAGRWLGTAITTAAPVALLLTTPQGADGKPMPAWRAFWALFGASNQLLAALALIGITVWLWRTRRAGWVWLVAGAPMAFMFVMSTWALLRFARDGFISTTSGGLMLATTPVPWVALVLIVMAAMILIEAGLVLTRSPRDLDAPLAAAA